ncbi:hypothetical protein [Spirosoma aerolatum]|uniref:hypothetical protein n=1 Tax=Spirosoma aerolatum TaxID=1211326 RepID=UPI0009ACEAFB|nr:hypothetical protein [Spirosoma aerolatum]
MRNITIVTKIATKIDGTWLRDAIDALGVSVSEVTRQMGLNHNKRLYQHFNNDSHLGGSHLLALKQAFPKINLNYVVAGEMPMLLTSTDEMSITIVKPSTLQVNFQDQ